MVVRSIPASPYLGSCKQASKGNIVQNRYAGDIGDYVKFALLRQLAPDRRLGVAWYLHPDEEHNDDGNHVEYLRQPDKWRSLDPELFDVLNQVVSTSRSVEALMQAGAVEGLSFTERLKSASEPADKRCRWRSDWFERACNKLADADLVFADPDNGLVDDAPKRRRDLKFAKQMPLQEALALAAGRTAVIYHHNTRRKGGHDAEVDHWLGELPCEAIAIRARAWSSRTFFILNPNDVTRKRAAAFCERWAAHKISLH